MIIKKYKNLQLCIECPLIKLMTKTAIHHYPNEYGGFLLGYYSDDFTKLYVKDFLLVDKYASSPVEFRRELNVKTHDFEKIFQETGHPNASAWYSLTDLQAMNNIASCNTVQLNNPVLLILSISNNKLLDFNFFIFDKGRLIVYESC